jgi:sulfonate transport system substrate-binding protein
VKKWFLSFLCLALLLLGGCGKGEGDVLRLAYQTSIANAVAMVADKGGFLTAEGLQVKSQILNSGPMVNEVLAAGQADVGVVGDVPAILAISGKLPVKIITAVGGGNRRQRLMIPPDSPVASLSDLVGKRLGITFGSSGHGGYYRLVKKHNLKPEDITLVNLNPTDMPEALAAGEVDAVLVWEPTPSLIEARKLGRELLTLADTDNLYPMVALVNTTFARQYPEQVKAFVRALIRAAEFIEREPEAAARIVAEVTGLAPELALKALDYHFFGVYFSPAILRGLEDTGEFLVQVDTIPTVPDLAAAVDTTFLPEEAVYTE